MTETEGGGGGLNGCLFYGLAGSRPVAVLPKWCTRDHVNIALGLYYKDVNKGVSCGSVREPFFHILTSYTRLANL